MHINNSKIYLSTLLVLGLFIYPSKSIDAQNLPSYPSHRFVAYDIPDVPKAVKNIKVTVQELNRNNSLEVEDIKTFNFRKNGSIKSVEFINSSNELYSVHYYDKFERIKLQISVRDDPYVFNRYNYNDSLLVTKRFRQNSNGKILRKNLIEYSSYPFRPIKFKTFKNDSTLADSTILTYTEFGDLKTRVFYNTPNGYGITVGKSITGNKDEFTAWPNDTVAYLKYKYDQEGNILERRKFDSGALEEKNVYTRKTDTLVTTTYHYSSFDGKITSKKIEKEFGDFKEVTSLGSYTDYKYIYSKGQLKSELAFENQRDTTYYNRKYTYKTKKDDRGQMVELRQFEDGKLIQLVTRKIEYWN